MSKAELVRATDLARPTVVYTLSGERAITVEAYIPICEALGIDAARLLDEAAAVTRTTSPDAVTLAAERSATPTDRERMEAAEYDDPA